MKRIGKWLLGLITSALTLVLVIVLLPYAAKWVARIMPDESAAAIRASVVLSQKLEQSAKLETLHVTEEGALNYEIKAAFLGTVASINADYTYEGSFGIDLQQVTMNARRVCADADAARAGAAAGLPHASGHHARFGAVSVSGRQRLAACLGG